MTIAAATSERSLQRQIAKLLTHHGIPYCWPAMHARSRITVGWPDFTFAVRGIPVAWECKSATGTVRNGQATLLRDLEAHGWRVRVIRSLDEALRHLKTLR